MKIKKFLYACLLSILALGVSYVCTNLNVSVSGERDLLKWWNFVVIQLSGGPKNVIPDDVLFINVSMDKELVDIKDDLDMPMGNAAITDRQKLASLLSLIKSTDYKYVLLDVFFEDGYNTETDSMLFHSIASMDRIVIPCHHDGFLADSILVDKAAFADYTTTLKEDNITKYPLLDKGGINQSIPLVMYSDITGRTVTKRGLFYMDGNALSRRVVFPKMEVVVDVPSRTDKAGIAIMEKPYLNMGADILDYRDLDEDWGSVFGGKVIVIGSFTDEDIHLTYAGDLPGCVINYNVFASLMDGRHKVPFLLILVYFLIFFAMSCMLLRNGDAGTQSLGWLWAKLFVIYSIILTIVCIFVFTIWGQAHDVFITSTLFSIVDTLNQWITKKKNNA